MELHSPVLVKEACHFLRVDRGKRYIDATLGLGGHCLEIVKRGGEVLGLDADSSALDIAILRLSGRKVRAVQANFREIDKVAREMGFEGVDGILFDLGVSSEQLLDEGRGFSFSKPVAVLDMRIDQRRGPTAANLLNVLREDQLVDLFSVSLSKLEAKRLAERVVARRRERKFEKVGDFLELFGVRMGRLHPATKAFLALRIAVNSELTNLEEALPKAFELLSPGGRLLVISFHSREDKIVKSYFRKLEEENRGKIVTRKPVKPTEKEIKKNPRSRSAIMRVIERKL